MFFFYRSETPALFQVLAEKRVERVGGAMMGSTHIYEVGAKRGDTVELALDPSELDLVDTEAMAQRYEQRLREQQSQLQKEDLSDMLAEHVARQKVTTVTIQNTVFMYTFPLHPTTFVPLPNYFLNQNSAINNCLLIQLVLSLHSLLNLILE